MDLHVTLASAPPCAEPTREIVVDTVKVMTGAVLHDRLMASGLPGPFFVDGVPLQDLVPHTGPLVNGATVVSGTPDEPSTPRALPHLMFVVRSGPDAGQVVPLTRGNYTIGRDANDIVIADPDLSRRHAVLTVTQDAIVLEDLQSANGTHVDGVPITSVVVTVAMELRFGSSICRLEFLDDQGWGGADTSDLLAPLPVGPDLPVPPPRILLVTAFLPLVLGVVLAVTTGMWFFLAFSALSAVTGTVPLLTHRRNAKVFREAVRLVAAQDARRREDAVPDPGQTAVDALRAYQGSSRPLGAPTRSRSGVVLLRLGTADQPANLSVKRDQASFVPPTLAAVPLVLPWPSDLSSSDERSFTVTGKAASVNALARALLLQLSHPQAPSIRIVCWGSVEDVPSAARFLPDVHLTADSSVLTTLLDEAGVGIVFQFSDGMPPAPRSRKILTIRFRTGSHGPCVGSGAGMIITSNFARVVLGNSTHMVAVDGVSAGSFERAARALGRASALRQVPTFPREEPFAPQTAVPEPPRKASLWNSTLRPADLLHSVEALWSSSNPEHPTARLGDSGTGTVSIDLMKDGPHFLVAGTTGSGKSEFLRTLVLSLASNQPPEHLTVVLVDYKGGSGLGVLTTLPHCVGSLTDLSSESTARALTSLRAELRWREQLCADHGVHDLDALRRTSPSDCPPRLVVVIDEFRMLSDEVPTAVGDLMKVAALGRSLGIHLILATQRAQGAVTPDIRANITTTILLRVQTPMESQDLLGSSAAADIPVDAPGRAFLRRGMETPVAFQVGSCSDLPEEGGSTGWKDLTAHLGALNPKGGAPLPDSGTSGQPGSVLPDAVRHLVTAAEARSQGHRRCPILPPLPNLVTTASSSTFAPTDPAVLAVPGTVPLGVVDLPDHQEQRFLHWNPVRHSHLALVGLPGSGAVDALAAAVSNFLRDRPDGHVYLLDGDGTFGTWSSSPHIGAHVQANESKRAARVLARLADLPHQDADAPPIVLAVTGWGRWTSQFRQGRFGRAEEDLHTLVRDGAHTGVTLILNGDRELTTARFFALVPNRVYLPLGAHPETTMTWPKMPPLDAVIGRGFAQGPMTGVRGEGACQLLIAPASLPDPLRPPPLAPFPVHPLPTALPLQALEELVRTTQQRPAGLLLGVQGDELAPFRAPVGAGDVYLVLGAASSGRSNVLQVLARSAERTGDGRCVVMPGPQEPGHRVTAADFWRGLPERLADIGPPESSLLLVDDADRLPVDVQQILSGLVARGAAAVITAAPGPSLMSRVPLSLQARSSGTGLVLMPRSPSDGDFFGQRLDIDGPAIRGRAFACDPSGALEVHIALAPAQGYQCSGAVAGGSKHVTAASAFRSSGP